MKKLVTLLIVALPIVFVIALLAVTQVSSLSTEINPTGISITGETFYQYDMANYTDANRLYEDELGIKVEPTENASVQDLYTLKSITDSETGEDTDIVLRKVEEESKRKYFELRGVGRAKITYVAVNRDGKYNEETAHTASIIIDIITTQALDFTPKLSNGTNEIPLTEAEEGSDVDYTATILTGSYILSAGTESGTGNSYASFTSANPNRLEIDQFSGALEARFSGNTIVTVKMGLKEKTILFDVSRAGDITVDGEDISKSSHLLAPLNSTEFSLWLETDAAMTEDDISIEAPSGAAEISNVTVEKVSGVENAFKITVTLAQPVSSEQTMYYTLVTSGERHELCVDFARYSFTLSTSCQSLGEDNYLMLYTPTPKGESEDNTEELNRRQFSISSKPKLANATYNWEITSGTAYVRIVDGGQSEVMTLAAKTPGEAKLKVTCTTAEGETLTAEYTIVVALNISSLLFFENSKDYGMGTFALASDHYISSDDSATANEMYDLGLKVFIGIDEYEKFEDLQEDVLAALDIELSDKSLAELNDGALPLRLHALETGSLEITVRTKYGNTTTKLKVQTVKGIEISGEEQADARDMLERAMQEKKQVVLGQDVYLGEPLFNYNGTVRGEKKYSDADMKSRESLYVHKLPTTWDWTYYKNSGKEQPTVNYALEITANIYGNGHQINAEYVTNTTDSTGKPYFGSADTAFNGPLNFVSAEGMAAVKGQDNIVFLVREAGLTVDNVVLLGCNDESLHKGDDSLDLNLLQYMGTTLEVMNDFTLTNSRVRNGRTVMRIYGKDGIDPDSPVNAAEEKIKVNIKRCELSVGREFLLKMGTNRYVHGTKENPSPSLAKGDKEYDGYNSAASDARITPGNSAYDADFVRDFVLTEVVLENSTLSQSGLFSIGMESHFAGKMLMGVGDLINVPDWDNLAGTSYPAVLRLVGNVVLNDWKELGLVDSSTLIECNPASEWSTMLTLNIPEMLKVFLTLHPEYDKMIATDAAGKNWVHGGIAMYGGGKNYHGVDTSAFTGAPFNMPTIKISILKQADDSTLQTQGEYLPQAAGDEAFRFLMYFSDNPDCPTNKG